MGKKCSFDYNSHFLTKINNFLAKHLGFLRFSQIQQLGGKIWDWYIIFHNFSDFYTYVDPGSALIRKWEIYRLKLLVSNPYHFILVDTHNGHTGVHKKGWLLTCERTFQKRDHPLMMSDDFWRFLTPHPPLTSNFLPSNVQFFGVISDPPSPLKLDITNGLSLRCLSIKLLVR